MQPDLERSGQWVKERHWSVYACGSVGMMACEQRPTCKCACAGERQEGSTVAGAEDNRFIASAARLVFPLR